jgi:hypothetical protein
MVHGVRNGCISKRDFDIHPTPTLSTRFNHVSTTLLNMVYMSFDCVLKLSEDVLIMF